jgi:hypothetical protein
VFWYFETPVIPQVPYSELYIYDYYKMWRRILVMQFTVLITSIITRKSAVKKLDYAWKGK